MAFGPCSAFGAPNGLNQIPIAKVYGDQGVALSVSDVIEGQSAVTYTTQYGLFDMAEIGLDYQASPSSDRAFLGNAKILLLHKPGSLPDVAIGVQNVATGHEAVPYAVATTQPAKIGVSVGVIQPVSQPCQVMGGISYTWTDQLQIVADAIAGSSNYSTLGVIANITPSLQFNVAYASPNGKSAGPQGCILNLTYIFHLHANQASNTSGGGKNSATGARGK